MPSLITRQSVAIPPLGLAGDLVLPDRATGIAVFAHGSGSGRHSPRNRYVAGVLQAGGFGTLLLDLLTKAEEEVDLQTRYLRFDIDLLAGRLIEATTWLQRGFATGGFPIGYFGASTGAAAALVAAAEMPGTVGAIVSRGGRPDLAGDALRLVQAPTLLIAGGHDFYVIKRNQEAMSQMRCERELAIVPAATHLFEEPGALEEVSRLAVNWFQGHLTAGRAGPRFMPPAAPPAD